MPVPALRMLGGALLLLGAFNASIYPYQSLIGIERIGFSEGAFALVMVLASAVAVSASVLIGLITDQRANRRSMALVATTASALGAGLMLGLPGKTSFLLAHGVLFPLGSSFYGQCFALSRLVTAAMPDRREVIQSAIRAALSLSFLGMLLVWSLAFSAGAGVMHIYLSAALGGLALVALVAAFWPRDGSADWQDPPSGLRIGSAMRDLARAPVLLRLLCLGAIASSGILYMVLISLVCEASALRDTSDVALYVGLVAAFEVPAMLLLPRRLGHLPRTTLLAAGTAIYASHLVLMPVIVDTPLFWALTPLAGLGGTAIITVPIGYYQDLMIGRPGTAGAMLALQKLAGDVMAAAAFALGMRLGGYGETALLGAALSGAGALGLLLADRLSGGAPVVPMQGTA